MNMIVAVDKNWGIGYQGQLLNSIPEDMKYFRETTTDKVIVMGRKTLESFPAGRPLPKRTNIVITGDINYEVRGAIVVHSIEEALEVLKDYATEDVFIIGGESIYRQFLPYADIIHVTKMDYVYQADTWFPNLDEDEEWQIVAESEEKTYFSIEYAFYMYARKSKLKEIQQII